MDHADSGLECRFDQIQHPIRRQDDQPLTLPFAQNSIQTQDLRQIFIQQKYIKILYQIQLLISLHHNKFLD